MIDFPADVADEITEAFGFCSWNHRLPRGVIVCTAVLSGAYKCGPTYFSKTLGSNQVVLVEHAQGSNESIGTIPIGTIPRDNFGDYGLGRWAWLLTDVQPLDPPVPERGRQRWWTWRS